MTNKFIENCYPRILSMCSQSEALKSEHQYETIKFDLVSVLQDLYNHANIHLFGSRIIGLAKNDSDLDIFVEIGNFKIFSSKFPSNKI